MSNKPLRLHVIGAASAAADELCRALEATPELFDAAGSHFSDVDCEGEKLEVAGEERWLAVVDPAKLPAVDVVVLLPGEASSRAQPAARASARLVLDAAGLSFGDAAVPLVLPGVNEDELDEAPASRTLALPAAETALLAPTLLALEAQAGLQSVTVTSLVPASFAGLPGIEQLSQETRALLSGRELQARRFPHRLAFNAIPQVGPVGPTGETTTEARLSRELARLLGRAVPIEVTALLVPIFYGQLHVVRVVTSRPLALEAARTLLRGVEGAKLLDVPAEGVYPMPMLATGDEETLLGRVRVGPSSLTFVLAGDDLRAGLARPMAALLAFAREEGWLS